MTREPRSMEELVAEVTPRVLAEALEQAVDRARDELADQLTRAIVERATASGERDRPSTSTPRTSTPTPTRAEGSGQTGLYAFAIVPAGPVDLAGIVGIDGHAPLRILQQDELGLVVSAMPLDLMDDVSEDDLSETGALATLARRHDEVVRSVFEHGPVLPLRFGTVVADEDGARRLLDAHAPAARRRLAHLDTHREWGVRLTRQSDGPDEAEQEQARAQRRDMTGTSYLAARRDALQESQRAEHKTATLTAQVEDTLREQAVDLVRRGAGSAAHGVADVAYLVPRAREDAFLQTVERLRDDLAAQGLGVEVTGPWPPYSFAALDSPDAPSTGGRGAVSSA